MYVVSTVAMVLIEECVNRYACISCHQPLCNKTCKTAIVVLFHSIWKGFPVSGMRFSLTIFIKLKKK